MALNDKDKLKRIQELAKQRTLARSKNKKLADKAKKRLAEMEANKSKPSTSKSPSFGQKAASTMTGGQSFKTVSEKTQEAQAAVKPKPKPKPQPAASKPKPKPQPAASKPKPKPKPNPNENPDRVNKTLSNGSPNPRHPMYDGAAGFKRYNRDRAEWERKQKKSARRVNRRGRVISK
jgi:hypothetical protein